MQQSDGEYLGDVSINKAVYFAKFSTSAKV